MLPDIIEHDELKTGQRREGSFYAIAAFFQKLGTGAALWADGTDLRIDRVYHPDCRFSFALPSQKRAVLAIRWFASIIPAGLLLLSIFLPGTIHITRDAHEENLAQLEGNAK